MRTPRRAPWGGQSELNRLRINETKARIGLASHDVDVVLVDLMALILLDHDPQPSRPGGSRKRDGPLPDHGRLQEREDIPVR